MSGHLFPPPPMFGLPLSKGQDLAVTLTNIDEDDNELVFPVGATAVLIIESDTVITQAATIAGAVAEVVIQSTVADELKPGKLWRFVLTDHSFTPPRDTVVCNGVTERFDGRVTR